MRTPRPETFVMSFVLLLLVLAVWKVSAQLAGITLYRPLNQLVELGWGYMSPTGAGDDLTPTEAKAQLPGTRIYPRSGTYVNYDPDWVVVQPELEGVTGTGEPLYWAYITPDQIP